MIFNQHSDLRDKHAFLSPSSYHWLNYDEQKLEARFHAAMAARRGSDIHDFAHEAIRLGLKLDSRSNEALATYVKDAIGYKMVCEQTLYYSPNCFGTADTVSFRRNTLRIHDLKTGISKVSMLQLKIYAALFCLEYEVDPRAIDMVLRIYQRNEILADEPEAEHILEIMEKIVEFDRYIQTIKEANW